MACDIDVKARSSHLGHSEKCRGKKGELHAAHVEQTVAAISLHRSEFGAISTDLPRPEAG